MTEVAEHTIVEKQNAESVLNLFRWGGERNAQQWVKLIHPDCEMYWPPALPYGGLWSRAAGIPQDRPTAGDAWNHLQPTPGQHSSRDMRIVAATTDEVCAEWVQRGLAPDGEEFQTGVLGVFRFQDGKIIRAFVCFHDPDGAANFLARHGVGKPGSVPRLS